MMQKLKDKKKILVLSLFLVVFGLGLIFNKNLKSLFSHEQVAAIEAVQTHSSVNVQVVLQEALICLKNEQYLQGIQLLEKAIQESPGNNTELKLALGMNYRRAQQFGKAREVYEELLLQYPSCWECVNNLAVNEIAAGQFLKAIEALEEILTKQSQVPELYLNLAIAYDSNGDGVQALKAYHRYLKLVPMNDSRPDPALARERIRLLEGGVL